MASSSNSGGSSLGSLLLVVFVVLKLTHVIDWSWIWVLSPLWIGSALVVVLGLLGVGVFSYFNKH